MKPEAGNSDDSITLIGHGSRQDIHAPVTRGTKDLRRRSWPCVS